MCIRLATAALVVVAVELAHTVAVVEVVTIEAAGNVALTAAACRAAKSHTGGDGAAEG